jgi:hypothetical protein
VPDTVDEFDGNAPPSKGLAGAHVIAASIAAFSYFGLAVDYAVALGRARASCVGFRSTRL